MSRPDHREGKEWEVEGDIDLCVRCGKCRSACPLFRVRPIEDSSARGKLALLKGIREGEISPSPLVNRMLRYCLLCGSCRSVCPLNIEVERAVIEGRKGGGGAMDLLMSRVFTSKRATDLTLRTAGLLLPLFFKKGEGGLYMAREFLHPSFPARGINIKMPGRPLSLRLDELPPMDPELEAPPALRGKRVSFFYGCLLNHLFPETGLSVIKRFRRAGVDLHIPAEQVCCGIPLLSAGDLKGAGKALLINLHLFRGSDLIVVACATCGSTLKRLMPSLIREEEGALQLSRKVVDFSQFFDPSGRGGAGKQVLPLPEPSGPVPPFSIHYPCHLTRGMEARGEMEAVLRRSGGDSLIPSPLEDFCCGFGGTFSLKNPELSLKIMEHKVRAYPEGIDYLVTSCPGCIMSLAGGLNLQKRGTRAIHVADFLDLMEEGVIPKG